MAYLPPEPDCSVLLVAFPGGLGFGVSCIRGQARPAAASVEPKSNELRLLKAPSAWIPLALSLAALALVLGHAAISGVVHEADEGAAAHTWQLLMALQAPLAFIFLFRWLPRNPRGTLLVLGLLGSTWLANFAAVYFLT